MEQRMTLQMMQLLNQQQIEYKSNVLMSEKTWIHRGPIIPLYVMPHTESELVVVLDYLVKNRLRYLLVGHTSNVYIKESFDIEVVITTIKMTSFQICDTYINCAPGVNVSRLSKYCVDCGYEGFEGLVGLPGTVGAAVVNNSSCFGCSVSDLLIDAKVYKVNSDNTTEIKTFLPSDFVFKHRSSNVKRREIQAVVIQVRLAIKPTSDIERLREKASDNIQERRRTQEGKANNLGSIFSGYMPHPIGISSLGIKNILRVLCFRIWDHFNRGKEDYHARKIYKLLSLYGYRDIVKYVSPKNINCFVWRDNNADKAFDRYKEFMHLYAECKPMEIEVFE